MPGPGTGGPEQGRAGAVAVRPLGLGDFRIGNDVYADQNGSFGLTTRQRQHVRKQGSTIVFRFVGKSGIEHTIEIDDVATVEALDAGVHAQGKKVVEEAAEVWMAAEHESADRTAEEISQLLFRVQVIMLGKGLGLEDVYRHL